MTVIMRDALVQVAAAAKTFGSGPSSVVAVHGVDAAVLAGDRIAITGPSGSGKSTLLHLLAGLETPTAGSVVWPALWDSPRRHGERALVFQGPSLLPVLDVLENVALPLVIDDVADTDARHRAFEALRVLDIAELNTKLPEEISAGQAQRVAIARALVTEPRLILADEPTGRLDHTTAVHVIDVLIDSADRLGAALVVATHDATVVRRLTDHWVMRDGVVVGVERQNKRSEAHT